MKTRSSLIAVSLLLVLLTGCKRELDPRPPEQFWNEVCATCHAANGAGLRHKLGKSIDMRSPAWQSSITDAEIEDAIRNGRRGNKVMVAFGDTLSDEQIEGLVKYVRGLGK